VIATGFTERKDVLNGNVLEMAKHGRMGSASATAWRRRNAEVRAGATFADDGVGPDLEVPTYLRRQAD
jgi:hypothetical protein